MTTTQKPGVIEVVDLLELFNDEHDLKCDSTHEGEPHQTVPPCSIDVLWIIRTCSGMHLNSCQNAKVYTFDEGVKFHCVDCHQFYGDLGDHWNYQPI